MRRNFGLSTIALAAAMLAGGTAFGQGLNIGGVSVDLGGSGSGGPGVSVTTDSAGSSDSGSSASGSSESTLSVDVGGSGSLLGGSGDDDGSLLHLKLFGNGNGSTANAVDVDVGGVGGSSGGTSILDLGGSGAGPTDADVNLKLFGDGRPDATASVGETTVNADVLGNAGPGTGGLDGLLGDGGNDSGAILDLFGPGDGVNVGGLGISSGPDATVDLSGENTDPNDVEAAAQLGGDPSNVIVDIFGGDTPSTGTNLPDVTADLSGGGDDPNDVQATIGSGPDAGNVVVDIFGTGAQNSAGGGGSGDNGGGAGGDNGGGGAGGDNGGGGGPSGGNGVADNSGGIPGAGSGTPGAGGNGLAPTLATRVANADVGAKAPAKCFAPDETQIRYLLSTRHYDSSMGKSWAALSRVSLVPVRLCPEARIKVEAAIEADSGIRWLQGWANKDRDVSGKLRSAGLSGDNVLALEDKNQALSVYVY
jgi:hypothetical protein